MKKEGYEVFCAYDGNDAVDLIYEEEPDIVLLDIMLPGRDGMEVCREVRKIRNANHHVNSERLRN